MDSAERSDLLAVFSEGATDYDLTVPFFQPLATDMLDRVDLRPGQRVLDIGCGRGAVTFQAAERVGPAGEVVGIDIVPAMVDLITADVARRGASNVSVHLMDGQRPDFAPESFDHVVGSLSIVMMPSIANALAHYRTLLRDGGTVAFTTPAVGRDPLELRLGPFYLKQFLAEAVPDLDLEVIAPHLDVLQQAEPHRILTDLRQAGFRNPMATDVITVVNAPTAADLVRWTFTCATRVFWNLVPEPRRSEYAQQMIERIESEFGGRPPQYDTVSRVYLGTK